MKVPKFKITGSSITNVAGTLVIVYLVVLLGQTIKHNYDLGQQVQGLKQQISLLDEQKDALNYQIQYEQTDSAMDRAARQQLDLQLPGENVIIIPNDSPKPTPTPQATPTKATVSKSNFQQWVDFMMGKS